MSDVRDETSNRNESRAEPGMLLGYYETDTCLEKISPVEWASTYQLASGSVCTRYMLRDGFFIDSAYMDRDTDYWIVNDDSQ